MAGVQSLFTSGLVSELRTHLTAIGIRENDRALGRLVRRFLHSERKGSQPRLLEQARGAIASSKLNAAQKAEFETFFKTFFSRRDALLKSSASARPDDKAQFAARLSSQDQEILNGLLKYRQNLRLSRSDKGQLEAGMNEIFIASLENAHLPKADFIKRVAPLHEYTVEQLARDHFSLKSGWKAYLAVYSAGEVFYSVAVHGSRDPKDPVLAKDLSLLIRLISLPFDLESEPKTERPAAKTTP